MQNRQFIFAPKIQYELVAERSEANPSNLQIPVCAGGGVEPALQPWKGRVIPLDYTRINPTSHKATKGIVREYHFCAKDVPSFLSLRLPRTSI